MTGLPVRQFVRSPLAVRCNMVKFWRPLPADLWSALDQPEDVARSRAAERQAIMAVLVMAIMLWIGLGSVGWCDAGACFPLIGKARGAPETGASGWYYAFGQSWVLVAWVVVPSLLGWMSVRLVWIRGVAGDKPTRDATLAFARHIGSVYLFVYLMILAGAALMIPLVMMAPRGTHMFRWCLWCFLFGESFFVPAAVWLRLVVCDRSGRIFGKHRYPALVLYLVLFVVVPILGMVQQLG